MGKSGTKKIALFGVWIVLLVGVIVWMSHGSTPPGPNAPPPGNPMPKLDAANLEAQWPQIIAQAAAPPRGNAQARYTLAEFGDFQCPQCGKARPVLEKMLTDQPALVNLIFLHRPFPSIHEWALPSGQASEIAATQGKFWPMYDLLYSHQDDLEPGFYGDYAAKAGLDKAAFQKAFDAGQGKDKLKAAVAFADTTGIQETPTVLVRDNVSKSVTIFVGMDTAKNHEQGIPYSGIADLVARPPWAK